MGGISVSGGAEYQAAVVAYVAVRMLLGWRLNWSAHTQDVPVSVAGEVSGPGDDLQVGLRDGPTLEVQAKRALAGRQDLIDTIGRMVHRADTATETREIILVVGGGTHADIRDAFATDVRHYRAGRTDHARRMLRGLLEAVPDADRVLRRLVVVPLDLDTTAHQGVQQSLSDLRQALRSPEHAERVWAQLERGGLAIGRGSKWDRADVDRVIRAAGSSLRPLGADAQWLDQLDVAERLLTRWRPRSAFALLMVLMSDLSTREVGSVVHRRLCGLLGRAAAMLGRPTDALHWFTRATDYVSSQVPEDAEARRVWCHTHLNLGFAYLFTEESGRAGALARRVVEVDDSLEMGWALRLRAGDITEVEVPSTVARSAPVRHARAQRASAQQDFVGASTELEAAVRDGATAPDLRLDYAAALLMQLAPVHVVDPITRETPARSSETQHEERRAIHERVERLTSTLIDELADAEVEELLARAYFFRARAREELGDREGAEADDQLAYSLQPSDVNVVLRQARQLELAGDPVAALALLTDAAVTSAGPLLVYRATLRVTLQDPDGAARDLERAASLLDDRAAGPLRQVYLDAGTAALEIARMDLADTMLSALERGDDAQPDWLTAVLRARHAAYRRAWPEMEAAYSEAMERMPALERPVLHLEIGDQLLRAGMDNVAIPHLEAGGGGAPSHPAFARYVKALMRTESYPKVLNVLETAAAGPEEQAGTLAELPPLLLRAATHIRMQQGDFMSAAHLADAALESTARANQAADTEDLLLAAQLHAQLLTQPEVGEDHRLPLERLLERLIVRSDLLPARRAALAHLYMALGDSSRALSFAYRCFRASPTDQAVVETLLTVALAPSVRRIRADDVETDRDEPAATALDESLTSSSAATDAIEDHAGASEASPDSGEEAQSGTPRPSGSDRAGTDRSASGGPAANVDDPDRDDPDLSVDGRDGVVGPDCFVRVRVDGGLPTDLFLLADGPVTAERGERLTSDPAVAHLLGHRAGQTVIKTDGAVFQRWHISRVLPAVVVAVRRAMRTFAVQFPERPRFRLYRVGETLTMESLGPVRAELYQGRQQAERVLAKYADQLLPLGVIADVLGRTVVDLASAISDGAARRLAVEGPPHLQYDISVANARSANSIVLTRPALEYLDRLGLWPLLSESATLLVPRSMLDEWDRELVELQERATRGNATMVEHGGWPTIATTSAESATEPLARSRDLYTRVTSVARVAFRPASMLGAQTSVLRDLLGTVSFDAAVLASAEQATLYADDLGLRVVAHRELGVRSFSTGALLDAREQAGRLAPEAYDQARIRLAGWRHDLLPIRASTIVAAYREADSGRLGDTLVGLLADARLDEQSAAVVGANALYLLVQEAILPIPLENAAQRVARALLRSRDPSSVMPAFVAILRQRFQLLPRELDTIQRILQQVLRERLTLSPPTP